MWPFSREKRRDDVLESVNKGVLAAIGQLQQKLLVVERDLQLEKEGGIVARTLVKQLERVDARSDATRGLLEEHVSRLDQAVTTLRGQLTGGRGGRPRGDPLAADIGRALVEALGPEKAAQLANEIVDKQNGVSGNGRTDADAIFA